MLPAAAVAFFITVELPIVIKYWIYRIPVFLTSTIINVLVLMPLYGLMVGGLAVFVGEFVLWPALAIDKERAMKKVEILKAAGMWPVGFKNRKELSEMLKVAKRRIKERKAQKHLFRFERL